MKRETILVKVAVHPTKAKIWRLGITGQIETSYTLRKIGDMVGEPHPHIVKHHLDSLLKMGAIDYIDGNYVFPIEDTKTKQTKSPNK